MKKASIWMMHFWGSRFGVLILMFLLTAVIILGVISLEKE